MRVKKGLLNKVINTDEEKKKNKSPYNRKKEKKYDNENPNKKIMSKYNIHL